MRVEAYPSIFAGCPAADRLITAAEAEREELTDRELELRERMEGLMDEAFLYGSKLV